MAIVDVNCDEKIVTEDTISLPSEYGLMYKVRSGVVSSNVGCEKLVVRRLPNVPLIKVRDDSHLNKIGVALAKVVRNLDQLVRFTAWGQLRTCNGILPKWILPYDFTQVVCSRYMSIEMLRANTNAKLACADDFGILCRERALTRPLYVAVDVEGDETVLYVTDGVETVVARGTIDACLAECVMQLRRAKIVAPKSPAEIVLCDRKVPYLVTVTEKPTCIAPVFVASVEHSGHVWVSESNATRVGAVAAACALAIEPVVPEVGDGSLTKRFEAEALVTENRATLGTQRIELEGEDVGYIGWVKAANCTYRSIGMFPLCSMAIESACSVYYGVHPPIRYVRDHESIARRELKIYESQLTRFKYDVVVGPERVGIISSIVAAIAPACDIIVAPGDGIGVVGLACRIMGIPCVTSDLYPSDYAYVPVLAEDALTTVRKVRESHKRCVILLSHVCEFVPILLDVAIATGALIVVFEEQDMISGLSKLTRCSRKIWASHDLVGLLTPLGNVDRTKRLALNLMSEQLLAHTEIGFAASTAMREIKYVANLGIVRKWVFLGPRDQLKGANEMLSRYGQSVGTIPDIILIWSELEMRYVRNLDNRGYVFLDMRIRRVASYEDLYKDKRIIRELRDQSCFVGSLYTIDCDDLADGHGLETKHNGRGVVFFSLEPGVKVLKLRFGRTVRFTFVPP